MLSDLEHTSHRSYRRVPFSFVRMMLVSSLIAIFFVAATVAFYPYAIAVMKNLSYDVLTYDAIGLQNLFRPEPLRWELFVGSVVPFNGPESSFTLYCLLFALFSTVLCYLFIAKGGLYLWYFTASLLLLLSAGLYYFIPGSIPYTFKEFCDLYFESAWLVWIATPFFISFSLIPVPCNALPKFSVVLTAQLYSISIGIVRFGLFSIILVKGSFLFMPVLYFLFGPLLDIYIVVALLGLFTSSFKLEAEAGTS